MLCVASPPILCGVTDPAPNIRAQQLAWIDDILAVTGWSPTELARRSHVDQTTITRFKKDQVLTAGVWVTNTGTLSARTVAKVAEATGWDAYVHPELGNRRQPAAAGDIERLPVTGEILANDIEAGVRGIIAGRNAAFPYLVKNRALETAGVLPGDIAVIDQNETPRRGDVVMANIDHSRIPGQPRGETVLRVYEQPFLVAATFDPTSLRPLSLHDEHIAIMGVMIGLFRRRRAAA